MIPHPNKLGAWLERLQQTSLPSFTQSIQSLCNPEKFSGTHSVALSKSILKDPSLTASVLKLANSGQFNRSGSVIRTVSRGVMLLGYKSIKEICTSCLLLDNFVNDTSTKILKSLLARSFHAAIQAKEFANIRNDNDVEEIFISALLMNIGEISIYASLSNSDDIMNELALYYPFVGGKEKDIVGCYFNDLTLSLCKTWKIAPMIEEVVSGQYNETSISRSIILANSFALSCEQKGIKIAIKKHLKTISRYCNQSAETMSERLQKAADTANRSLKGFGLSLDGYVKIKRGHISHVSNEIVVSELEQLDAVYKLSTLVQKKYDINLALKLLIQGLSRGAGFECCLVGLYDPQRTTIKAKYIREPEKSNLCEQFIFKCANQIPEILQKVLINKEVILLSELRAKGKTRIQVNSQLHHSHSIWGPLIVENQVIGCLYADNGKSDIALTPQQISAFKFFVYQARSNLHSLRDD